MRYEVDHVIPRNRGGTDDLSNKRASHRTCNRAKSDRLDGGPVLRRSGSLARPR
ncbi:HNH endonuclease signature motif containing protein [Micromonospora sp. NPDC049204]|uniref:HNH endonuclease signature motif containing protein n=1 Tax=Micromonospora sp. NPDC049204 TaxID=3154351 RepID=UPI003409E422